MFSGVLIYRQYNLSSFSSSDCFVIKICSGGYKIMAWEEGESSVLRLGKIST